MSYVILKRPTNMKQLTFKLILPLTVISFATFTKWWCILPLDAPDTMFRGFSLAYSCPGWHTSMSLQIFATEFIVDFLIYFLLWFILVFCINYYLIRVKTLKLVTIGLWTVSGFIITFWALIASNKDNIVYIKRPFDIQILETGYEFIWQNTDKPDYNKYFLKEK